MSDDSNDLREILNEAIPRWAKLTGTQLGGNSYTFVIGSGSEFQDYDLKKYLDDLNEARVLDATGTTAILLLRGLFEAYVQEKSATVHALLYAAEKIEKTVSKLREFHALISRPACEDAVTTFRETLRRAAVHYGYDLGKLGKLLADDRDLGELRLAASRSLERLATHQFTQGARDPKPLQYNRQIFEFSSVNSFVHALRHQMVSGITLALIRGPDAEDVYKAYFVLGLRNGETTTILTDFQEGPHPEYHDVTRRPDKRLDERARQHWFPYRLLDEDPARRQRSKTNKTAIVPLDARAVPIEEVSNLDPPEFVWLTLLFDLVAQKFDRDDYKTPDLSYTAEMVVAPHVLVEATSALVLAGQYKPLVLPKLTVETTTPDRADNEKPLGHNAWLEDRYRHLVPEILLDVIGWGPDHRVDPIVPRALDPTYFGTARDIERNRTWYARINLIQGVQRLATAEFAAKHQMIVSWYRKRLERNMAFLWKAVATGKLVAPTTTWKSNDEHDFPVRDKLRWKEENILSQKQAPKYNPFHPHRCVEFGGWDDGKSYNVCALDPPTRATVFTQIWPDNPRALALLMGIPEKKLPWPLQHWTTHEPYTGNSILNRIDPQDSRLDDPWRHLDLSLSIALSKRAYNRLRREHDLPVETESAQKTPKRKRA